MFEDDDDFEIDEEFLGNVYNAEKSAISSNCALDRTQSIQNEDFVCDLQPSPAKKRKSSPLTLLPSSFQDKHTTALRTSEETARLVASAAKRREPSQGMSLSTLQFAGDRTNNDENVLELESRSNDLISACQDSLFRIPDSPSPDKRNPSKNRHCTESTFTLNTSRIRQRKFPGPAGLLPERERSHKQGQRPAFSSLLNVSGGDLDEAEEPLSLCSQSTASVLEDVPWLTLQSDLASGGQQQFLGQYTVAWVKQRAAARQLFGQKVPFLAAVLHSIDCSSPDPCVVLRDSTGEIPGTLHRSVWDSFGGQLIAGSALVLRFVGVLSTGISARRHYLNITSNNIVTIYSSPLCESSVVDSSRKVRKTDVHKWALSQLVQGAKNWEEQSKRKKDVSALHLLSERNPFSSTSFSSGCPSTNSLLATSQVQFSNTTTCNISGGFNSGVHGGSNMSRLGPPTLLPLRSGNNSLLTSRPPVPQPCADSSVRTSSNPSSSSNPIQGASSLFRVQTQLNSDPLRVNLPSTSKATSNPQNKFVPKKSTFSFGAPNKIGTDRQYNQINISAPSGSQSSRDLFSDADDLDISSVLDGLDSESLFGDF